MVLRRPTEPGAGEVRGRPPPTPAFIVLLLPTLALPPGLVPTPRMNIVTASLIRYGSTQNKKQHTLNYNKQKHIIKKIMSYYVKCLTCFHIKKQT